MPMSEYLYKKQHHWCLCLCKLHNFCVEQTDSIDPWPVMWFILQTVEGWLCLKWIIVMKHGWRKDGRPVAFAIYVYAENH